jgi:hypothetical protein
MASLMIDRQVQKAQYWIAAKIRKLPVFYIGAALGIAALNAFRESYRNHGRLGVVNFSEVLHLAGRFIQLFCISVAVFLAASVIWNMFGRWKNGRRNTAASI